jgi:hypothetical protein
VKQTEYIELRNANKKLPDPDKIDFKKIRLKRAVYIPT